MVWPVVGSACGSPFCQIAVHKVNRVSFLSLTSYLCFHSMPPFNLIQNRNFDWRKMSNFDETLQTDQIEGAEFEFLDLEDRFERNKRRKFLNVEIEILEPKSKFRLGHAWSRAQKSTLQDSYKIWPLIIRRRENCHAPKSTPIHQFCSKIALPGLFSVLEKHFSSTS